MRSRSSRIFILLLQVALLVGFLCVWQIVSGTLVDDIIISRPSDIVVRCLGLARSGVLAGAIGSTLEAVAYGLLVGGIAGYLAGLAAGLNERFTAFALPLVDLLFAIPKIALIPLFILWFGVGLLERSLFTAVVVFFFIFYAVMDGMRALPDDLLKLCRLLRASATQRIRLLYVPATLGWTFAGLRIATPYAFVSAIGAEVINARNGLGSLVRTSGAMLDTPGMFVGILASMACATLAAGFLAVIDRRFIAKLRPVK